MNYRFLQTQLKPYKAAGYTTIRFNAKKAELETEYYRLLQLGLSQGQLESAIADHQTDTINGIDPLEVLATPERYKLSQIKAKVFQLANLSNLNISNLKELRENYPLIQAKAFNFRHKSAWIKCLQLISEITQSSHSNQIFYQAVERAIEIELKSQEDDFHRYETPDPDLYTILSDYNLAGISWEKQPSDQGELMRSYILHKCRDAGLDPDQYFISQL
ncbi:MAG: hypothetical protein HC835_16340 [Oscillatoriales cyanobacterium RM2_1_1]|nr:hypothetical protein [Oscillatoriales cyanobacterium SM2_3_0]NJO47057.1 hypothetical protein [Oscillatoriales cyanobacterium RM2_1_1]